MFSPINLKFKKVHKKTYKNQEYSCKNSGFLYGSVGIVSKSKGFVSFSEISSAQKVLSKVIKGTGLSIPRVRPQLPRTQKKKGMRMGKGKGEVTN